MSAIDTLLVSTRLRRAGLTTEQADEITRILDAIILDERTARPEGGRCGDPHEGIRLRAKLDALTMIVLGNVVLTWIILLFAHQ